MVVCFCIITNLGKMSPLEKLIQLIAKLPGLGPRSARRIVLFLLKKRDTLLLPLMEALQATLDHMKDCKTCGNIDVHDPCHICTASERDSSQICVVEDVSDLWAIERARIYRGRYHVLGGTLSALNGVTPDDLRIPALVSRVKEEPVREIILALSATVDGQTTSHYVTESLSDTSIHVSRLGHGLPIGSQLDYLDDGTLVAAIVSRKQA